jgi:hypothetical protein
VDVVRASARPHRKRPVGGRERAYTPADVAVFEALDELGW